MTFSDENLFVISLSKDETVKRTPLTAFGVQHRGGKGVVGTKPGEESFDSLVGRVERGVYMETNCSWSIDDSRNKFQFGCERGRLIENGSLGPVVKNPNYRGISASFWRSLDGVGNAASVQVLGTPFCGKGEPNQVIRVGHASPPCLFRGVEVFGGGEPS